MNRGSSLVPYPSRLSPSAAERRVWFCFRCGFVLYSRGPPRALFFVSIGSKDAKDACRKALVGRGARAGGMLHGPEQPPTLCTACARPSDAAPTSWWVKVVAAGGTRGGKCRARRGKRAAHAATARMTGALCGPFTTGIGVRGLPLRLRMSGKDAKNEPFEVRCAVARTRGPRSAPPAGFAAGRDPGARARA
jgi:hypothetical protein